MKHASKTQSVGYRTQSTARRPSHLNVTGKDPAFDYCFRKREEIEKGGGIDQYGYEPVGRENNSGEDWALPDVIKSAHKKRSGKSLIFEDVILCKRPKEVSQYFQQIEDQKYNLQVNLIKEAAPRAQAKLRMGDQRATVTSDMSGMDLSHRKGPTIEEGQ